MFHQFFLRRIRLFLRPLLLISVLMNGSLLTNLRKPKARVHEGFETIKVKSIKRPLITTMIFLKDLLFSLKSLLFAIFSIKVPFLKLVATPCSNKRKCIMDCMTQKAIYFKSFRQEKHHKMGMASSAKIKELIYQSIIS